MIAGLAGNHAPSLLARTKQLGALPIAGLPVPAPYYVRPSQAGNDGEMFATLCAGGAGASAALRERLALLPLD